MSSGVNPYTNKLAQINVLQSADKLSGGMDGDKALTLDGKGRLAMVDLDKKAENGFVRFFKGIFSSSYRSENWGLKDKQKIATDPQFIAALSTKVSSEATFLGVKNVSGTELTQEMLAAVKDGGTPAGMKFQMLFNRVTDKGNPITLGNLIHTKTLAEASEKSYIDGLVNSKLMVVDSTGKKMDVESFVRNHTSKKGNVRTAMLGAAMQSLNAAVLTKKDLFGDVPEPDLRRPGKTLRKFQLTAKSTSEWKKDDFGVLTETALGKVLRHYASLIETGKKNGLSDEQIADKIFDYTNTVNRVQEAKGRPPMALGNPTHTPSMTK